MDRRGPKWCRLCRGENCLGGGKIDCIQRDPKPSHIAGILDGYGGVRVVVAHKSTFKKHLACGEFLCVVPHKLVHEPIKWNDIPMVVRLGEIAVETFIEDNSQTNDPDKQIAIRAWKSRRTWQQQRTLHLPDIAFT